MEKLLSQSARAREWARRLHAQATGLRRAAVDLQKRLSLIKADWRACQQRLILTGHNVQQSTDQ